MANLELENAWLPLSNWIPMNFQLAMDSNWIPIGTWKQLAGTYSAIYACTV